MTGTFYIFLPQNEGVTLPGIGGSHWNGTGGSRWSGIYTMTLISIWSLIWDIWAFYVHKRLKSIIEKEAISPYSNETIFRWIGLDILFVIIVGLLYLITLLFDDAKEFIIAIILLVMSLFGALLDTVLFNPSIYLGKKRLMDN